jgi:hypothetical protein
MSQSFKTIYFSDYPAESSHKKNLTLAFSSRDASIYEAFKALSSQELRETLGHDNYESLQRAAAEEGIAVNTYCMRQLRKMAAEAATKSHPTLPSLTSAPLPLFDPIQTTFRGGQAEPLHDWYPYLEGYSPQFVEQVLLEFAPQAARVLDPFAGSGTTPLTVANLGRQAFYCELNPLLQYLIEGKTNALTADDVTRLRWAAHLRTLANQLKKALQATTPDELLKETYSATFGDSKFFDDDVFIEVLRARTFIDKLACTEPFVAHFFSIAVLSSLLLASRLIRRGDVRFRTEAELNRRSQEFVPSVQKFLRLIAADLERINPIAEHPILVCENARYLDSVPPLKVDGVVTSPPYLNGTNYFRNTKVELWFLRCLKTAADLAGFRQRAITAGINDVTVGKALTDGMPDSIAAVVKRLRESAYDMRIPLMAATYFSDMNAVFEGLKRHITRDCSLMIDIGDSAYAGVHVPTHTLLTELLTAQGFSLEREIVLRRRMSRSGEALQQFLLVFRATRAARIRTAPPQLDCRGAEKWTQFKIELPHQQGEYIKRNWGHPLHSLCSYQGKMKPSLAHHLIKTFVPKGGRMLDMFGGTGTIPFEAALQGAHSWSFDISPAAHHIANAKIGSHDTEACERLMDALEAYLRAGRVSQSEIDLASEIKFNGALPDYFAPETFREILLARRYFLENLPQTPSESLVFASLLHVLHGNRPYALSRRSHPITPFAPTGPAEYRPLMKSLRNKVRRSLELPYTEEFVPGRAVVQDATGWWPQEVNNLDAIITSPPFFDSTRFYLANWMRLWFCGWEWLSFKTQPMAYVDERQKTGFEIYDPIFRQSRERLKAGGVFVLHLGESRKCDMAQGLKQIASRWFSLVDLFSESVRHCESHGIRDKGTVTSHQYLVLG